jgi:hypothetical protein
MLMSGLKGADTIDEAVNQFYENPDKYSQSSATIKYSPVSHTKETKSPIYSPPPYAPPAQSMSAARHRPHTNAVIQAGNVRARDEVRFFSNFEVVVS